MRIGAQNTVRLVPPGPPPPHPASPALRKQQEELAARSPDRDAPEEKKPERREGAASDVKPLPVVNQRPQTQRSIPPTQAPQTTQAPPPNKSIDVRV